MPLSAMFLGTVSVPAPAVCLKPVLQQPEGFYLLNMLWMCHLRMPFYKIVIKLGKTGTTSAYCYTNLRHLTSPSAFLKAHTPLHSWRCCTGCICEAPRSMRSAWAWLLSFAPCQLPLGIVTRNSFTRNYSSDTWLLSTLGT